ncbi:MAG: glutamyl-tRNA synthetase [Verrucomicrobiales bacterium]|nr:glutamyl-tRNA synthetase [Verrucomicrobiales bacterium]
MSTSPVRVRFAPSPTGYLHVGGARTALFNWLFARREGGTLVLRVEDTDAARNTAAAQAAIVDGLRWLGIDWDEGPEKGGPHAPYHQSQRGEIYERYFQKLVDAGHTYVEENGAVRFRSPKEIIILPDKIGGDIKIDRTEEPDMTIRRPDGSFIFHFVNVVDDIEMEITHVIRGEDHIYNTGKHIELFRALGAEPPVYAHIPLILNADGSKMSKRDQGAAVGYYQEEGYLPEAVANYLCLLGWSPKDDREILTVEEILPLFRWENMGHSNAKFDLEKCGWMNAQYLAKLDTPSFDHLAIAWLLRRTEPLPGTDSPELVGALALIKPKIKSFRELAEHLPMLFLDDAPVSEEARGKLATQAGLKDRLTVLLRHLDGVEGGTAWTAAALQAAVAAAAAELGVKPGALMFPLRVLATGQAHGVDLLPALEWLGKTASMRRLQARLDGGQIAG